MQTSLLSNIIVLVLLHLHTAVLAIPHELSSLLTVRQAPAPPLPSATATPNAFTDSQCLKYGTIANLSTIGANSSYRAAFLQNSPEGTYASAAILNNAIAQIPLFTNDANLNQQCGNLTTIATNSAADNFTRGIVAQFSGLPPPSKGFPNAMVILFLGVVYIVFMGVLFNSL
ncbi:hypothetical protein MMC10_010029 [Thelotrema lepadinum]|nr:hypothetical protein [Thelotrema lepadinum]